MGAAIGPLFSDAFIDGLENSFHAIPLCIVGCQLLNLLMVLLHMRDLREITPINDGDEDDERQPLLSQSHENKCLTIDG